MVLCESTRRCASLPPTCSKLKSNSKYIGSISQKQIWFF
uniref:Putative sulfate transporter 4.2 isoform X1 n=1 Tax=Rhizophora mucronata TaxID=61149 RepID=A0A2P2LPY2_RHIMU